ncbi:MAG: isoprenylcysteine carboxylmethyltransferase family protein [Terracidiphilus sp.]
MILTTLQIAALIEVGVCWAAWSLAFLKPSKQAKGQQKVVRAPASRWGIFMNFLGFACVFAYVHPRGQAQWIPGLVLSMVLAPLSVLLVWAATRHLGKHWRYEAALSADHELVQSGAYAWIRHPIYASMLGMLLATGLAYTWWPSLIAGVVLFLIGIEIRVHAEDRLLEGRFGQQFIDYRSRVKAYIPFVR